MGKPVYSEGKVHVMPAMCSTCIFRPGNLMTLQPGRVKGMVDEATANESVIPCHKTIHGQREQEAVCRGYYDAQVDRVHTLWLAAAMNIIEEVEPDAQPQ